MPILTTIPAGYKLRKHIAKALQARSQAVRTALENYNAAAQCLSPPRPPLTWSEVVEYAFLADFDLLRDTRQDVRESLWARPASRSLMDRFFKIERAGEEIKRLNVEIPRVITYIADEEAFLLAKEADVRKTDPQLAHQITLYRLERGRADATHIRRFAKLAAVPGCTASIIPGVSLEAPWVPEAPVTFERHAQRDRAYDSTVNTSPDNDNDNDNMGEDEDDRELASAMYNVLRVSGD